MKNNENNIVNVEQKNGGPCSKVVAVLGTGNFGQAVAMRLSQGGVPFVIGSRSPRSLPNGLQAINLEEAIKQSGLIILAVPYHAIQTIPLSMMTAGQVVVDCSNRTHPCNPKDMSQAEQLSGMLPEGVQV